MKNVSKLIPTEHPASDLDDEDNFSFIFTDDSTDSSRRHYIYGKSAPNGALQEDLNFWFSLVVDHRHAEYIFSNFTSIKQEFELEEIHCSASSKESGKKVFFDIFSVNQIFRNKIFDLLRNDSFQVFWDHHLDHSAYGFSDFKVEGWNFNEPKDAGLYLHYLWLDGRLSDVGENRKYFAYCDRVGSVTDYKHEQAAWFSRHHVNVETIDSLICHKIKGVKDPLYSGLEIIDIYAWSLRRVFEKIAARDVAIMEINKFDFENRIKKITSQPDRELAWVVLDLINNGKVEVLDTKKYFNKFTGTNLDE